LHMFQDDSLLHGMEPSDLPLAPSTITVSQDLVFDPEEQCLVFKTKGSAAFRKTKLTASQSSILSYLVCHPYRALGNREIAREALGYENLDECEAQAIIRPHILRLRRKLERDAHHPEILRTVRGSGYIFSPD
jgi:DNA-binding response OmpR family regulator